MAKEIVLTPAAVNKYLKNILEQDKFLKYFTIGGEISNFKRHSSGTLYFSIKDNEATISCAMWKNNADKLTVLPKEGDQVELKASIYLNVKTGYYSLNVSDLSLAGAGDLYKRFLALKNDLEKQGYFSPSNKQAIPSFVKRVGVITSPTSAAVRDIITTIKRRYPICEIVVIPTLVQGVNAKDDIAKNINRANELGDFDVLIVGRGGGSIEDLWAFNELVVANAAFNSKIPIISSVGHETDTTIIDYIADMRAPTPTAAAELATPDIQKLNQDIDQTIKNIASLVEQKMNVDKIKLDNLISNQYFLNPILKSISNFDNLSNKLNQQANNLNLKLSTSQNKLENNLSLMTNLVNNKINNQTYQVKHLAAGLDQLNPLAILSRGYGVVYHDDKPLVDVNSVDVDDEITLRVTNGNIKTRVISKETNE